MTDEQFDQMVAELERYSRENPSTYHRRVILLAAAGYAYFIFVMVLLMAGIVGIFAVLYLMLFEAHRISGALIKLAIVGFIAWGTMLRAMLKAMFMKFEPPKGVPLTRENAPRLYEVINQYAHRLNLLHIDHVLLTDEFNAFVTEIPKFSLGGPSDRYLCIGLPLMEALSGDQFKAVLGHELGHLSRNHSRTGNWVYRVRSMWARLLVQISPNQREQFFLRWFLNSYVPYFEAYSYVMSRDNEYEADAVAAELTSKEAMASALITIKAVGHFMGGEFYPDLQKRLRSQPSPPVSLVTEFRESLSQNFSSTNARGAVERALRQKHDPFDTHPVLRARVGSIGLEYDHEHEVDEFTRRIHQPDPATSATTLLLAPNAKNLTRAVDERWTESIAAVWRKGFVEAQKSKKILASIPAAALSPDATDAQLLERARLLTIAEGDEASESVYDQILARSPANQKAIYNKGRILLEREDPRGMEYFARLDNTATTWLIRGAAEEGAAFLKANGRDTEIEPYVTSLAEIYKVVSEKQQIRTYFDASTPCRIHHLLETEIQTLRDQLSQVASVRIAYLFELAEPVPAASGEPSNLLVIEPFGMPVAAPAHQQAWNDLGAVLGFEHPTAIFLLQDKIPWIARLIDENPNAEIYRRL